MHIMEGYLPLNWCIIWFVVAIIVVAFGIYQIKKISTNNATHNDKNNINKENENIKEGNKDEQEMANYMEKRRSVKIGEKEVENFILNKNENNLGKNKKMKIKNGILNNLITEDLIDNLIYQNIKWKYIHNLIN